MQAALSKILVVVGTTGAGKTKLSIDLAKALNGEIVNSDAMQMYRGLDVATAKVTREEMEGVPHHLLSCIDPVEECTVVQYKTLAMKTIQDILARGKVPVIVGGTMYYTQSLLWNGQLLEDVPGANGDASPVSLPSSPEEVYRKLQEVDPVMAESLHSKDVRRVQRSLEVFLQTGRRHSDLIAEQQHAAHEKLFDACAFWVDCDRPTLNARLDKRVDKMIKDGLVPEIEGLMAEIQDHVAASPIPMGLKGITQAIGFKEFEAYLAAKKADVDESTLAKVLESCVEELKTGTRQYAKRQVTWIRNRFVPRNIPVYRLDTADVARWDAAVASPALAIATAFLRDAPIPHATCQVIASPEKKAKTKFHCEPCGGREFVGDAQWNEHLRSKGHRFHVKRVRLLESGQLFERSVKKPKATEPDE
ncbi:tRNA isopentenyltransferase [Achlya hypogyna]|uniref:tRNA isopentenyltransferase n=1 Tax=Achlya hypogyna TaxID=1202772 RepID=A0A1V9ZSV0_ACHHY|nr:tRNA isopentenyltransferase [Achlya hypogyna]